VAEWCKSNSTSDGTLLEKWNHAMSPLNTPLFPDEPDRRPRTRVLLYEYIIEKAREYRSELYTDAISNGKVGSSGSEPGRNWDWERDLVCLCGV
jgi:hypothetical protein